jgi:hypothetical protein
MLIGDQMQEEMKFKERKITHLSHYEEAIGVLHQIHSYDYSLIAEIGTISLAISQDLEKDLVPHLGRKIGIIRTDLPGKEYLIRVYPENSLNKEQKIAAKTAQAY